MLLYRSFISPLINNSDIPGLTGAKKSPPAFAAGFFDIPLFRSLIDPDRQHGQSLLYREEPKALCRIGYNGCPDRQLYLNEM